jgi:hypothetical protein
MTDFAAPVNLTPATSAEADAFVVDTSPSMGASPTVPDGIYELSLSRQQLTDSPFEAGKKRRIWEFALDGEEGTFAWFTSEMRGDKIVTLLSALGVPLAESGPSTIKMSDLIGRRCRALIQKKASKKDPSKKYCQIVSLMPLA